MRRKRFAAPPFLFLGAAFFLHRFGGERERGVGTLKSGRGREVQKIFRFAKLQFYFGTKSDWGERERRRERVREKER